MKHRKLVKRLEQAGFPSRQGKGDHEVWSNGDQQVVLTQTREVSPGLACKALEVTQEQK